MTDIVLSLVILALAALHAYWGLGGLWPSDSPLGLARMVAGFRGIEHMPSRAACFAVALALSVAAASALLLSGRLQWPLPRLLLDAGGLALTLVFLARGLAAYLPAWRRLTPEQPFARLDRLIYGPLCLVIAALSTLVTLKGR